MPGVQRGQPHQATRIGSMQPALSHKIRRPECPFGSSGSCRRLFPQECRRSPDARPSTSLRIDPNPSAAAIPPTASLPSHASVPEWRGRKCSPSRNRAPDDRSPQRQRLKFQSLRSPRMPARICPCPQRQRQSPAPATTGVPTASPLPQLPPPDTFPQTAGDSVQSRKQRNMFKFTRHLRRPAAVRPSSSSVPDAAMSIAVLRSARAHVVNRQHHMRNSNQVRSRAPSSSFVSVKFARERRIAGD